MAMMQVKQLGVLVLLLVVVAGADGVCVDLVDVETTLSSSPDLVATFIASDRNNAEVWRRTVGPGTSGSFGPAISSYQFVAANSDVEMCVVDPCSLTLLLDNAKVSDFWVPLSVRIRGHDSNGGLVGERTFKVIPPELVNRDNKIVLSQC